MTEEEKIWGYFERSRSEYEVRSKELIPVRMKIALEGFNCSADKFEVAPQLVIRRASLEERQGFYSRTNNPKDVEHKAADNEFFADFDFTIPRGSIQGLAPGNGINLVSVFFAIACPATLNINRGNFYLTNGNEFKSAGFYTTPNEYRFTSKVKFTNDELNSLRVLWPHFQNQFEGNFSFALVARRYFYSQLRLNPEDCLIDLMIAVEALLVPEQFGTKSDKSASRLSKLIEIHFDRHAVHDHVIIAYKQRNLVVHGGGTLGYDNWIVDQLSKYVQAAIQVYLIKYPGLTSRKLARVLKERQSI